jgi:hypothetical protein
MTKNEITRRLEDLMRYDSNPLPHSLNWQQDLQKRADVKRATAQKIREELEDE